MTFEEWMANRYGHKWKKQDYDWMAMRDVATLCSRPVQKEKPLTASRLSVLITEALQNHYLDSKLDGPQTSRLSFLRELLYRESEKP